jgi:phosphatidate phosphatase APP1
VEGAFVYTPAVDAVLPAGTHVLSVAFTPTDAVNYSAATATVSLTVRPATPTITWPPPAEIIYGTALGAVQLNATSSIEGTFTYEPAAGDTPAAGTNTLLATFTPTDVANYTAATATVSLNVLKGTPPITWPTPTELAYGTALSATQLNATSSVEGTFVYTPAAEAVLAAGTHPLSVTFTPTDAANYSAPTATVSLNVRQATPTITWSIPAETVYGTPLSAGQLNATSSVEGTFTYEPAAGVTPSAGTHALSVTFTPTDAENYSAATATVLLTVRQATATVSWPTPAEIGYGTPLSAAQLNATSSVEGTFVYTPAADTVLAAGTHALSVAFTPTDAANYSAATATVSLTVLKGTPTISWPTPADTVYGTALSATQLNATSSVEGTFTYTPAVDALLTAGTHTLSVAFTPTDAANYSPATATVSVNVVRATPTITWMAPTEIIYGTALSATQLNATSSVDGSFVYIPAAHTVLTAGSHTLQVTFTPTDSANYSATTTTMSLTVRPATPTITWATPAEIIYGTALTTTQLNATSSVEGAFVYTPPVDAVLGAGSHTLLVTFMPSDAANYAAATATVSLTVRQVTPTITWSTPAEIDYGTALSAAQLNATSSVEGSFTYTPESGAALSSGTHELSVTFTPTDAANYSAATATVLLTVLQEAATITQPIIESSVDPSLSWGL